MPPEERERASSGNPSDDSTQEATSSTPNRPLRLRFFVGNNTTATATTTTNIHREDDRNRNRIENQEEEEETPPVVAGEEECNTDDDQPLPPPAASLHVCEYCGSEFSSARALGGHKRIHGIKNKKSCPYHHGSLSLVNEKSDDEHACDVCPMKFSSTRALHGHMRMHPERPWRGMKPPSEQPSPCRRSEKKSRGGCDDLPNGLLAAKGSMSGRDDWKDIVDDEEAMGAVLGLIMLSQDTSFLGSCNLNKDRKIENSKRTGIIVDKGSSLDYKGKAKIVEPRCSDSDTDEDEYVKVQAKCLKRKGYCLSSRGLRIGQSCVDDRDRDDTITLQDRNSIIIPSPSTSWLKKYDCSTCNKRFSSKQGLGGHMSSSSHKIKERAKAKISLIGNEDRRRSSNDSNNIVESTKDHGCLSSLLMALAYNDQDRVEISNETIDEESNNICKNVQRFDLNQLPPTDDR